jgi:Ca2+-binding EF-hand superfamily protein
MARLDANSDGKLSMDEVSGRLKENFSRIDSNGDGFITKTELETNRPKGGLGPPRS